MKNQSIVSVSEYIAIIERIKKHYPNSMIFNNPSFDHILFRGISNEEYQLLPSIYRKDKEHNENSTYLSLSTEKGILKKFIQEGSSYLDIQPTDLFHWAEYAQHFGVPTRFLDWTSNPLVALHFACNGNFNKSASVWVLHVQNFTRKTHFENAEGMSNHKLVEYALNGDERFLYPLVYTPNYVDQRMAAQSSYFMVWGKNKEPLEIMFNEDEYGIDISSADDNVRVYSDSQLKKFLYRVTILPDQKFPLLHELDSLGINEKSLFPGMDGIGKYVERKFRLDYNEMLKNF